MVYDSRVPPLNTFPDLFLFLIKLDFLTPMCISLQLNLIKALNQMPAEQEMLFFLSLLIFIPKILSHKPPNTFYQLFLFFIHFIFNILYQNPYTINLETTLFFHHNAKEAYYNYKVLRKL